MIVTYGRIVHRLWNRRPIGETAACVSSASSVKRTTSVSGSTASAAAPSTPSTDAVRRRLAEKKRIVRMLVVVVALFALGWFPFFTLHVCQLLFDENNSETTTDSSNMRVLVAMLQLVGYANCCANPIIYCFMNDSFQQHLYRMIISALGRCCCCSVRFRKWAVAASAGGRRRQVEISSYRRRSPAAATANGNGVIAGGGEVYVGLLRLCSFESHRCFYHSVKSGTDFSRLEMRFLLWDAHTPCRAN